MAEADPDNLSAPAQWWRSTAEICSQVPKIEDPHQAWQRLAIIRNRFGKDQTYQMETSSAG